MSDSVPYPVTPQVIAAFSGLLFEMMSDKYGGDTTLNELRVMNAILRCHIDGRKCSVSCLIEHTGIARSTVSRSVGNLIDAGWLREEIHPVDRRRRVILLGPKTCERTADDIERLISWIDNHRATGENLAA